jgi:hypothetical protein
MCQDCRDPARRTMMCFTCPYVGCLRKGHIARHFQDNRTHRLSMLSSSATWLMVGIDTENGNVFCHECDDYIYDPTLEAIQRSKRIILGKRKRGRDEGSTANGADTPESSGSTSAQSVALQNCKSTTPVSTMSNYSCGPTRYTKSREYMLHVLDPSIVHSQPHCAKPLPLGCSPH